MAQQHNQALRPRAGRDAGEHGVGQFGAGCGFAAVADRQRQIAAHVVRHPRRRRSTVLATRVLDHHGQWLDCDRDDAWFPLRIPLRSDDSPSTLIGWLLRGPRPDGSFFGRDEREGLAEIADPVARAIRIVQQREAREQQRQSQQRRQRRRIATLERKLAELATRTAESGDDSLEPQARSARNGRPKRSSRAGAARG